jgi:hypothetical protein
MSTLTRKVLLLTLTVITSISLSSCGMIPILDEKTQDKAACDKLSEVWAGQGANTSSDVASLLSWVNSQNALSTLADRTESEVLPLSSMKFSTDIKELIKFLRKADSTSVFDRLASWNYGLDTLSLVIGHCVLVSKE